MKKEEIVQTLLDRAGGVYLEIGYDQGVSFRAVSARQKIAVDPALAGRCGDWSREVFADGREEVYCGLTSDAFFERCPRFLGSRRIGVALVDGLHVFDQALRDILHCLRHLEPEGFIVLHDCNPKSSVEAYPAPSWEEARRAGLPGWNGDWCGDVWKSAVWFRSQKEGLQVEVLDCDHGVGVIRRGLPENPLHYSPDEIHRMTYEDLAPRRKHFLNLKDPAEFLETLNLAAGGAGGPRGSRGLSA